ncbi:MAG: pilus assembly protein PilE, partial [Moraxella osloensis]|nr:pilus assembly protein PilE [Moraxella osloensis]
YKGFKPAKVASNGTTSYGYDETDNKTIYVPANSTSSNYHYKITLASVVTTTTTAGSSTTTSREDKSLVNTSTTIDTSTLAVGRNWAMLAIPNTNKFPSAKKILLNSEGAQCKINNADTSVTITSSDCGNNSETW